MFPQTLPVNTGAWLCLANKVKIRQNKIYCLPVFNCLNMPEIKCQRYPLADNTMDKLILTAFAMGKVVQKSGFTYDRSIRAGSGAGLFAVKATKRKEVIVYTCKI